MKNTTRAQMLSLNSTEAAHAPGFKQRKGYRLGVAVQGFVRSMVRTEVVWSAAHHQRCTVEAALTACAAPQGLKRERREAASTAKEQKKQNPAAGAAGADAAE